MKKTMIEFATAETDFGPLQLAFHNGEICELSFSRKKRNFASELKKKWPSADLTEKSSTWALAHWKKLKSGHLSATDLKKLVLQLSHGTDFQKKVWKALLDVPAGKTTSYSEIAKKIGAPKAFRAVGSAVGANPIGYLIPCHRVLPKNGGLGGFAWGTELKQLMLDSEK